MKTTTKNVAFVTCMTLLCVATTFAQTKDIVDTAVGAGKFNTLVTAVKAAGLVDTLKGDGPFTVFAPTDEAFAAVPKELLASLLKPENKASLQAVLTYHVVSGKILAGDVLNVGEATTVQGEKAPIGLTIGGANIVATDIQCTNGVIHVIDKVILPPSMQKKSASVTPANGPMIGQATGPVEMIKAAIVTGSDLYNSGHHGECANLYVKTMVDLSNHSAMDSKPQLRNHLMSVMNKASETHSDDARAWMLRRGLDAAYTQVAN